MKKAVKDTKGHVDQGNRKIRDIVGQIPEGARILTDQQYGDQMGFVLRH